MRKGLTIDEGTALGGNNLGPSKEPVHAGLEGPENGPKQRRINNRLLSYGPMRQPTDSNMRAPTAHIWDSPITHCCGCVGRAFAGEPFTAFALFQRDNYCTNPTLGAGALPSGDSLMAPNCAS